MPKPTATMTPWTTRPGERAGEGGAGVAADRGGEHHYRGLRPVDEAGDGERRHRDRCQREGGGGLQAVHAVDVGHAPEGEEGEEQDAEAAVEVAAVGADEEEAGRTLWLEAAAAAGGPGAHPLAEEEGEGGGEEEEGDDGGEGGVRGDEQEERAGEAAQEREGEEPEEFAAGRSWRVRGGSRRRRRGSRGRRRRCWWRWRPRAGCRRTQAPGR